MFHFQKSLQTGSTVMVVYFPTDSLETMNLVPRYYVNWHAVSTLITQLLQKLSDQGRF